MFKENINNPDYITTHKKYYSPKLHINFIKKENSKIECCLHIKL